MFDHPKADIASRIIAAFLDGVMQFVLGMIPMAGAIAALAYLLLKDGLFDGQSMGKRIMKLQVIDEEGIRGDYSTSVKRNIIFAVPFVVLMIPVVGAAFAPFLALGIFIAELVAALQDEKGRRIGDKWTGTQVIHYEEGLITQMVKE